MASTHAFFNEQKTKLTKCFPSDNQWINMNMTWEYRKETLTTYIHGWMTILGEIKLLRPAHWKMNTLVLTNPRRAHDNPRWLGRFSWILCWTCRWSRRKCRKVRQTSAKNVVFVKKKYQLFFWWDSRNVDHSRRRRLECPITCQWILDQKVVSNNQSSF